jgi:hypothetical protein
MFRDLRSKNLLDLSPCSVRELCNWSLFFILVILALSSERKFNLVTFFKSSSPEINFSCIFTPFRLRILHYRECEVVDYLEE